MLLFCSEKPFFFDMLNKYFQEATLNNTSQSNSIKELQKQIIDMRKQINERKEAIRKTKINAISSYEPLKYSCNMSIFGTGFTPSYVLTITENIFIISEGDTNKNRSYVVKDGQIIEQPNYEGQPMSFATSIPRTVIDCVYDNDKIKIILQDNSNSANRQNLYLCDFDTKNARYLNPVLIEYEESVINDIIKTFIKSWGTSSWGISYNHFYVRDEKYLLYHAGEIIYTQNGETMHFYPIIDLDYNPNATTNNKPLIKSFILDNSFDVIERCV